MDRAWICFSPAEKKSHRPNNPSQSDAVVLSKHFKTTSAGPHRCTFSGNKIEHLPFHPFRLSLEVSGFFPERDENFFFQNVSMFRVKLAMRMERPEKNVTLNEVLTPTFLIWLNLQHEICRTELNSTLFKHLHHSNMTHGSQQCAVCRIFSIFSWNSRESTRALIWKILYRPLQPHLLARSITWWELFYCLSWLLKIVNLLVNALNSLWQGWVSWIEEML